MLADQTKVSPWINADPSVGFSCFDPSGGNRGDTVGDNIFTITFAPEPRHFTRHGKPLLVWRSCSIYFCTNISTVHSLDILRAKLTLLQCVVCAHARERWSERASENESGVWVKASRQEAEHSKDSGPGDQIYGLPVSSEPRSGGWSRKSQHCFARRASLDITLRFWCFRVVCVGVWTA